MSKYQSLLPVGKKIGEWEVKSIPSTDKSGRAIVECQCSCGRIQEVYAHQLYHGKTSQCKICSSGKAATLNSISNRAYRSSLRHGTTFNISPQSISESFSLQNSTCAVTGQALTVANAATVRWDNTQGYTPTNTVMVSEPIKQKLDSLQMDAKTFIGMCHRVADATPIDPTAKKQMTVREFFNKRANKNV